MASPLFAKRLLVSRACSVSCARYSMGPLTTVDTAPRLCGDSGHRPCHRSRVEFRLGAAGNPYESTCNVRQRARISPGGLAAFDHIGACVVVRAVAGGITTVGQSSARVKLHS